MLLVHNGLQYKESLKMDQALSQFFTWQFLMACLGIYAITFVVRTVVDYYVETEKTMKFWQNLVLPIMPIIFGGVGAWLLKGFPYPDGLVLLAGKITWAGVAGLLSSAVYRLINAMISLKADTSLNNQHQQDDEPTSLLESIRNSISKDNQ